MNPLDRLDDAAKGIGIASAIAGVVSIAATVYDQYCARKRNREVQDKDAKIRDLEQRLSKLEEAKR